MPASAAPLSDLFSLVQPSRLLLYSAAVCLRSLLLLPGRRHEEHHPTWSSTAPAKPALGDHQRPPRPPPWPPPLANLGLRAATWSVPRPTPPLPRSTLPPPRSIAAPVRALHDAALASILIADPRQPTAARCCCWPTPSL
jgi:hypothetical protein